MGNNKGDAEPLFTVYDGAGTLRLRSQTYIADDLLGSGARTQFREEARVPRVSLQPSH